MSRRRKRTRKEKSRPQASEKLRPPLTEIEARQLDELRQPFWRRKIFEISSLLVSIAGLLKPSGPAPAAPVGSQSSPAPASQLPVGMPQRIGSVFEPIATINVPIEEFSKPTTLRELLERVARDLSATARLRAPGSPTDVAEASLSAAVSLALSRLKEGRSSAEVLDELQKAVTLIRVDPATPVDAGPVLFNMPLYGLQKAIADLDAGFDFFRTLPPQTLHLQPPPPPE